MKQGSVHAAARASTKALRRNPAPARVRKTPATRRPGRKKARRPATLRDKLHAAAHALSAAFSAVLCAMFIAAGFLSANQPAVASARTPEVRQTALQAPVLDVDFDGRADLANPTDGFIRGQDAYGSGRYGARRDGGRRAHHGVDYVAAPGHAVHAPIAGRITRIGHAYNSRSGLNFVEIHDPTLKITARIFYVEPGLAIGDEIVAGEPIGLAQDLSRRYPRGITNHVHVELFNANGARLDAALLLPLPQQRSLAAIDAAPQLFGAVMPLARTGR